MTRILALMVESDDNKLYSSCPFYSTGDELYQMTRDLQFMSKLEFNKLENLEIDIHLIEYDSKQTFFTNRSDHTMIGTYHLIINKSVVETCENNSYLLDSSFVVDSKSYNFSIMIYKEKVDLVNNNIPGSDIIYKYNYYLTLPMLCIQNIN
jgi:hypothetical protein